METLERVGAWDLLFHGKGGRMRLLLWRTLLRQRIPNSTGSFKLDRQGTGATEVYMSLLDILVRISFWATHPQQYREFQPRQARNSHYWSVCVLSGPGGAVFLFTLSSGHIVWFVGKCARAQLEVGWVGRTPNCLIDWFWARPTGLTVAEWGSWWGTLTDSAYSV
jgi:hypothetical protein